MTETPLRYRGFEVLTLRQLDRLNNAPKGTTFRAFKHARPALEEGSDFFRLDAAEHGAWIETLRREGWVYPSTVHLVLITRQGYERMQRGDAETAYK